MIVPPSSPVHPADSRDPFKLALLPPFWPAYGDNSKDGSQAVLQGAHGSERVVPYEYYEAWLAEEEQERTKGLPPSLNLTLPENHLVIGTPESRKLAHRVFSSLGCAPVFAERQVFGDHEKELKIPHNVRGKHVSLIHTFHTYEIDRDWTDLLFCVNALVENHASSIRVVLPYLSYGRGDKPSKVDVRSSLGMKALLQAVRAQNFDHTCPITLMTFDPHNDAAVHNMAIKKDLLYTAWAAIPKLSDYMTAISDNWRIISPDAGGGKRAAYYARRLTPGRSAGICSKERPDAGFIAEMILLAKVEGMHCMVVDDMADSAGTATEVCLALLKAGAASVSGIFPVPVLSGPGFERLRNSPYQKIFVTDAMDWPIGCPRGDKFEVISIAPLLAQCIYDIATNGSIREHHSPA